LTTLCLHPPHKENKRKVNKRKEEGEQHLAVLAAVPLPFTPGANQYTSGGKHADLCAFGSLGKMGHRVPFSS
jgi:hypothetical protein